MPEYRKTIGSYSQRDKLPPSLKKNLIPQNPFSDEEFYLKYKKWIESDEKAMPDDIWIPIRTYRRAKLKMKCFTIGTIIIPIGISIITKVMMIW